MKDGSRLREIDIIKYIMMLAIVLGHSMAFFRGTWFTARQPVYSADYLYAPIDILSYVALPAFVMASGYVFFYLKNECGKYNKLLSDVKKRFLRLIMPYIMVSLCWVIPFEYIYFKTDLKNMVHKYLLAESPSQLWFLWMLFWVWIVFYVISLKVENISEWNLVIIFIISIVGGYYLSNKINANYFQVIQVFKYMQYYYLGGYVYKKQFKITKFSICTYFVGFLVCYILNRPVTAVFAHIKVNFFRYSCYESWSMLISVFGIIFVYFLISYVVKIYQQNGIKEENSFLLKLEENSFGIYLFHQQIIYITIDILNGHVHPLVQVLCSFLISIAVSLVIVEILKKNRYLYLLFLGGKL